MNFSYLIYQAEHVKSTREQREADVRVGELAEGFTRLWRSLLPTRRQPAGWATGEHEAITQPCQTASC